MPFTPWTTLETYRDLIEVIAAENLIENVAPIQLGIRLLIPAGSRLLELGEVRDLVDPFEPSALAHPWRHADPQMDALAARVQELADEGDKLRRTRTETFARIWQAASDAPQPPALAAPIAIPHFSEPWYCCAEPTQEQFVSIAAAQPMGALEPDVRCVAASRVPEGDGDLEADRDLDLDRDADGMDEAHVGADRDVDVLP